MNAWSLVISILVIIFLIVIFLISIRKGFLKMVLTTAAWAAAIVASIFLVKPVSAILGNYIQLGSDLALKALTLGLLLLAIFIVLWILLLVTKGLERVPLLKGFNRFLGGVLGLLQGMIWLWLIGLLIMAISGTPFGKQIEDVIHGSTFLTFLYNNNMIAWFFTNVIHLF